MAAIERKYEPMKPTPERNGRRRSSMFFESDLRNAAEAAADAMEEHGLDPDWAEELAEKIEDTLRQFMVARWTRRRWKEING